MRLPDLTLEDVIRLVPDISDVGKPMNGGQKLVFPCTIAGTRCAVKFMLTNLSSVIPPEEDLTSDALDEVTARARREVQIMSLCDSPYLVKLGPLPLSRLEHNGQTLICFSEEYIEGEDLKRILSTQGPLPLNEVVRLGRNVSEAIRMLWSSAKIHRDIKPGNIMRRAATGEFVLLDMGLAFDLMDESITAPGLVPGTLAYLSPEQTEFARKRQMDFRSDLFSLGIVLYQAVTGVHPFVTRDTTTANGIVASILTHNPPKPVQFRAGMPTELDDVIMRLLAKKPHLRYRTCEQLDSALAAIERAVEEK